MEETTQELDDGQRRAVRHFAGRVRDGDTMAEIFGVDDDQLAALEAQAYRLYRNGQFDKAKIAGRGILALDEERSLTHLILGDIALEEYRFSAAVEHLELAFELGDEQLGVRTRLGEALLKSGCSEQARRHLEAVVEADDDAGSADIRRCRVLLESLDQ